MVTGKQRSTWAAMALVCTITVLAVPAVAEAAPGRPTPRPSETGQPGGADGGAQPDGAGRTAGSSDLDEVRKRLDKLYHDAGVATEAYNAAEEKADRQSRQLVALAKRIVDGQTKLDGLQKKAGAAARAQYRGGGLPPEAKLMLSEDPRSFLDGTDRARQGQQATKGLLGELTRTQEDLRQYAEDASAQWKKLEANRKTKAAAKKKIKKRIAEAEKVESRLEKEERARLQALEKAAQSKAQAAWLDSGILDEIKGKASAAGRKAVAYASEQLGKPYEWGAEGPTTYDCSGLTSQAWLSAGRTIPRTSQEQWRRLPRIDIREMRPGDLIIYHDDASHVGMYIGGGSIIHAPRPGRHVTVAGAGSMSILGVVRPDK
ncbi:NlpC/P60 family protein [Streptomyces physcomitrii]|nr:NlpC/P60 family protein [Streptomyces physcomitrii]